MKYSDFNCNIEISDVCSYRTDSKQFTQLTNYCVRKNQYSSIVKSLNSSGSYDEVKREHDPIYYFKHFLFEEIGFPQEVLFKIKLGEIKIANLKIKDFLEYYEPESYSEEIYGLMTSEEIEEKTKSLKPESLFELLKQQMVNTTHIFIPEYEKIKPLFTCVVGDFYIESTNDLGYNQALELFLKNKGNYHNSLRYCANREYNEEELEGLSNDEILKRLLFSE